MLEITERVFFKQKYSKINFSDTFFDFEVITLPFSKLL